MLVGSDLIHFSPRVCLTYQQAGSLLTTLALTCVCFMMGESFWEYSNSRHWKEWFSHGTSWIFSALGDISEIVTFILGQIFFEDGRWIFRTCSV